MREKMKSTRRKILEFVVGVVTGVAFSYFAVVFLYPLLEKLDDIQRYILLIILISVYLLVLGRNLKKEKKLKEVM